MSLKVFHWLSECSLTSKYILISIKLKEEMNWKGKLGNRIYCFLSLIFSSWKKQTRFRNSMSNLKAGVKGHRAKHWQDKSDRLLAGELLRLKWWASRQQQAAHFFIITWTFVIVAMKILIFKKTYAAIVVLRHGRYSCSWIWSDIKQIGVVNYFNKTTKYHVISINVGA